MGDSTNIRREYERVRHFQPVSLSDRLAAVLQEDEAGEEVHLNSQEEPAQNLLDDDNIGLGTVQIQERILEYEGEISRYTRMLFSALCLIVLTLLILLPALLLQPASWCGNGVVELIEFCDDGNTNESDGCTSNCTITAGYECWCGHDKRCI
jgi:cysteine-rich repeat protein